MDGWMVRRCSQPRALLSASANSLTLPRTLLVLLLYSALYVVQLRLPPLDRRLITPYEDDPPDPFLITIFIFEQGQRIQPLVLLFRITEYFCQLIGPLSIVR